MCNTQWKIVGDQFSMKSSIWVKGYLNFCSTFGNLHPIVPGIVRVYETKFCVCKLFMCRVIQLSGWAHTATTISIVTQKTTHTLHMRDFGTVTWDGYLMTAKHKKEWVLQNFVAVVYFVVSPWFNWFFVGLTVQETGSIWTWGFAYWMVFLLQWLLHSLVIFLAGGCSEQCWWHGEWCFL